MRTPGIILACIALAAAPAHATVVDSAAGGFTVRHVVEVRGQAANAYQTLVDRIWANFCG